MPGAGRPRIRSPRIPSPAVREAPTPHDPDPYASLVGTVTHRVIGELVDRRFRGGDLPEDAAWILAGAAVAEHPQLGRRARAARLEVSGAAAAYLRRFAPPSTGPSSVANSQSRVGASISRGRRTSCCSTS